MAVVNYIKMYIIKETPIEQELKYVLSQNIIIFFKKEFKKTLMYKIGKNILTLHF